MDPRDRADEALARARARRAFVVTPDRATSPMDAQTTVQIPRAMMHGNQAPGRSGPDGPKTLPNRGMPPHPHPQNGHAVPPQHQIPGPAPVPGPQQVPPQQPSGPQYGARPGQPMSGQPTHGQLPPHAGPGMPPGGPHPGQPPQFPPPGPQYGGAPMGPGQHFGPGQPDQPTLPPPRPER